MPETTTTTTYQYDELSDDAKRAARDWYRQCEQQDCDLEYTIEDIVRMYAVLGVTVDTHAVTLMNKSTRHDPSIWYSLSYSQGDGACFDGRYQYAKGSRKAIRAEAPDDTALHAIADGLAEVQSRHFYRLSATVKNSGTYTHEWATQIHVYNDTSGEELPTGRDERNNRIEGDGETIADLLRQLMKWSHRQLQAEYEYRLADEQIIEAIRMNEYPFTEDGQRSVIL